MKTRILALAAAACLAIAGWAQARALTTDSTTNIVDNGNGSKTATTVITIVGEGGKTTTVTETRTVTKNADGSRTWTGERTRVGPDGKRAVFEETGSRTQTQDGAQWTRTVTGTNAKGLACHATTTGSSTKNDTGRTWSSTTNGTCGEKTWTANRTGSATRDADADTANVTFQKTATADGKTSTTDGQRQEQKTAPQAWSWTSSGTTTGPKGAHTWTGRGNRQRVGNTVTRHAERTWN